MIIPGAATVRQGEETAEVWIHSTHVIGKRVPADDAYAFGGYANLPADPDECAKVSSEFSRDEKRRAVEALGEEYEIGTTPGDLQDAIVAVLAASDHLDLGVPYDCRVIAERIIDAVDSDIRWEEGY